YLSRRSIRSSLRRTEPPASWSSSEPECVVRWAQDMVKLSAVRFRPLRIETERLTLRGYESSDTADIYEYASDVETTRFVAWERATAPDDIEAFLNSVVAPNYERQELDYAMTLRGKE